MSSNDIKYLADGRVVRVLAQPAPDRIVVEIGRVYDEDDPDAELFFNGTEVVDRVYDKAPSEAISREILDLTKELNSLMDSVSELRAVEAATRKRVDALKIYSQLERVEDFLAGKITHYVKWEGYLFDADAPVPFVSAVTEERCASDKGSRAPLKLLVLNGTPECTLEWKLNHYSDGSGSSYHCIPCCSLEEAQAKAREILSRSFAKYSVPSGGNLVRAEQLVKAAKACGAPIPDGFEAKLREASENNIRAEIDRCDRQREKWLEHLRAVRGQQSAEAAQS